MSSFHNFIKNVPKCIDCKHFLVTETKNVFANARCKKIIYNNVDQNVLRKYENAYLHEYEYAYIARSLDSLCGPHGHKFEPKRV